MSGGRKFKLSVRHDFGETPMGGVRSVYADKFKTIDELLQHIEYFTKNFPTPLFIEIEVEAGG